MPTIRDIILPLGALELCVTTDDGTAHVMPVPEGATRLRMEFDALAGASINTIRQPLTPRLSWWRA